MITQNKFLLRELVSTSFCNKYQNKFQKYKGKKLSNVFNLKMNKIHKISIGLIVVICAPFLLGLIAWICIEVAKTRNLCLLCTGSCLAISSVITNLILLIILAVTYKKSDLGEYDDFLDCKQVNKRYFDSNFSKVIKLKKYIVAFEIIDAIFDVLETIMDIAEAMEGKKKSEDPYPMGPYFSSNRLKY